MMCATRLGSGMVEKSETTPWFKNSDFVYTNSFWKGRKVRLSITVKGTERREKRYYNIYSWISEYKYSLDL
jgi:hypothetical protein